MFQQNQQNANINLQDKHGETALIRACSAGNIGEVKHLLEQPGIDVNIKNKNGYAALMYAAERGYAQVIKLILESKQDVNIDLENNHGDTALMLAIVRNNTEIVKFLLEKGANVHVQNNDGNTALMLAVSCNKKSVKFLLERGADVNVQNNDGDIALMCILREWRTNSIDDKVIELLLTREDTNIRIINKNGESALQLAAASGRQNVCQYLIDTEEALHSEPSSATTNSSRLYSRERYPRRSRSFDNSSLMSKLF